MVSLVSSGDRAPVMETEGWRFNPSVQLIPLLTLVCGATQRILVIITWLVFLLLSGWLSTQVIKTRNTLLLIVCFLTALITYTV